MSRSNGPRRAVAEISWRADPGAIVWVGGRSLHQYWPVLSAYFRDLLLPPQRRAEAESVSWSWTEPASNPELSASELGGIRKRLVREQQLFAENVARGMGGAGGGAGLRGHANIDQLGFAMGEMVEQLVARSDAELALYVCRTETGLRVHSWGAATPATVTYPDTNGLQISGKIVVQGKPGAKLEVTLSAPAGEVVARVKSDGRGEFRFEKVVAGDYRLRAIGKQGSFPESGVEILVSDKPVTGVVLEDAGDSSAAVASAESTAGQRGIGRWMLAIGSVAAVGVAAVWLLREGNSETESSKRNSPGDTKKEAQVARATEPTNEEPRSAKSTPVAASAGAGKTQPPSSAKGGTPGVTSDSRSAPPELRSESLPINDAPIKAGDVAMLEERALRVAPRDAALPGAIPAGPLAAAEKTTATPSGKSSDTAAKPDFNKTGSAAKEEIKPEAEIAKADLPEKKVAPEVRADHARAEVQQPELKSPSQEEKKAEHAIVAAKEAEHHPATAPEARAPSPAHSPDDGRPLGAQPRIAAQELATDSRTFVADRVVRVGFAPWRLELLRDAIVPTLPTKVGATAPGTSSRELLLRKERARAAVTLRSEGIQSGVRIDASTRSAEARWSRESASAQAGAALSTSLQLGTAEPGRWILRGARGETLAEVNVSADTEWTLHLGVGVRAWQWFALPRGGESSITLEWCGGWGRALPSAWNAFAPDAAGWRVEVPAGGGETSAGWRQRVALVDPRTGWGLASEVNHVVEATVASR